MALSVKERMNIRIKTLEAAGWKFGSASEFLGTSMVEDAIIEDRLNKERAEIFDSLLLIFNNSFSEEFTSENFRKISEGEIRITMEGSKPLPNDVLFNLEELIFAHHKLFNPSTKIKAFQFAKQVHQDSVLELTLVFGAKALEYQKALVETMNLVKTSLGVHILEEVVPEIERLKEQSRFRGYSDTSQLFQELNSPPVESSDSFNLWVNQNLDLIRDNPETFLAVDLKTGTLLLATTSTKTIGKFLGDLSDSGRENVMLFHTSTINR